MVHKNIEEVLGRLIAYFPLIHHGPHKKDASKIIFVAAGKSLPSCYLATLGGYTDRSTDSPLIRHGPYRK
jgi:hypothetical protein